MELELSPLLLLLLLLLAAAPGFASSGRPAPPPAAPRSPPILPASIFPSPIVYNAASLVVHVDSCWGSLTARKAFSLIYTDTSLLFSPSNLDGSIAAFQTFAIIDDHDSMGQVSNFVANSLSTSEQSFCSSTLPIHTFAKHLYDIHNFVERVFFHAEPTEHTLRARVSIATCMRSVEESLVAASFVEQVEDVVKWQHLTEQQTPARNAVVVARGRNEDVSWVEGVHVKHASLCASKLSCGADDMEQTEVIDKLPSLADLGFTPFLYAKTSPADTTSNLDLPFNVGGEAVIYLYHIIQNYDDLPPLTVFLQGEPIAGADGTTVHFNSLPELHEALLFSSENPTTPFQPLSNLLLQNSWRTGFPYNNSESVDMSTGQMELYEFIAKRPFPDVPSEMLWWHACGLFTVSKQAIRSRPKHFYEALYTMLTSAYPSNPHYPRAGLKPGGALDPMCSTTEAAFGLYCTQYHLQTMFYVMERMWQYIFDDDNALWHLDICGDDDVKQALVLDGRQEFHDMLCEGAVGAREDGWLVPLLKKVKNEKKTKPFLGLSLMQPAPASIVITKELDIMSSIHVTDLRFLRTGFPGMDNAQLCYTIGEGDAPHCNSYSGVYSKIFNDAAAGDAPTELLMRVWLEDENGSMISAVQDVPFQTSSGDLLGASNSPFPRGKNVLGVFGGHDATIAAVVDGEVVCVLELERLFNFRYMAGWGTGSVREPLQTAPTHIWKEAFKLVMDYVNETNPDVVFDYGAYVPLLPGEVHQQTELAMMSSAPVDAWAIVDHHLAHATYALHDTPWKGKTLVLTADGGGNDGYFHAYIGNKQEGLTEIGVLKYNLGVAYMRVSGLASEVVGGRTCTELVPCALGLPGKLMGYVALGEVRSEWVAGLRDFLTTDGDEMGDLGGTDGELFFNPLFSGLSGWTGGENEERVKKERDLSATLQFVFEEIVMEVIDGLMATDGVGQDVEGLSLGGGCALNVLANSEIQRVLKKRGSATHKVHICAAPGDNGLPVGAAWAVNPPKRERPQELMFAGFEAWDKADLGDLKALFGGKEGTTVEEVGTLLSKGMIVGVIRGRQEFGPRALGHRSLLSIPRADMKDRMNRLKKSEFFRPVAPIVAFEFADQVFEDQGVVSPYMSFAPVIRADIADKIPAVVHYDRTARPQTVTQEEEGWVWRLLWDVAKKSNGVPLVCNMSFNVRGKPIINSFAEGLKLLVEESELDFVLLEDVLFEKNEVMVKWERVMRAREHLAAEMNAKSSP